MNDKTPGIERLQQLMPAEQIEQLAELLEKLLENGFGILEIEIVKGKVRFFRPQPSIPACSKEKEV